MNLKLLGFIVLVLSVCTLLTADVIVYDDFSSGNLDKWDTSSLAPLSKATVVNEQLYFIETGFYEYTTTIIRTKDVSFDFSEVSSANPLEMFVTLSDRAFNVSNTAENYFYIGFIADNGDAIGFKAGFQMEGNPETSLIYYTNGSGGTSASATWYNSYFYDGDVIGIRVTDNQIMLLRNGNVFRTIDGSYGGETQGLKGFIKFLGPNNGGTVTLDNVSFSSEIPEPTTIALLAVGGVWAVSCRRKG